MTPSPLRAPALAAVAVGGALGAVLRHLLCSAFPDSAGDFPWTVFTVNVVGCALLALLPAVAVVRRRPLLTPLLGTGVLGGFTTMSTYGEQSRALAAGGHPVLAGAYVGGTLAAALTAVMLAGRVADRLRPRDAAQEDR